MEKDKVLIPIKGGLGNQMFGYAFYLNLKNKGVNCSLIWRDYIYTNMHNDIELLKIFPNIKHTLSIKHKVYIYLNRFNNNLTRRWWMKTIHLLDYRYFVIKQKNPYSFDSFSFNVKGLKRTYLLDGFWQNNLYFNDVSELVRKSFIFNIPDNWDNNYLRDIVQGTDCVSIHVRRGDYLKKDFSDYNVIVSTDYYYQSIKVIKKNIKSPIFIVFSDDIDWCKSQFVGNEFIFVEGNKGEYSYLDMYLMSLCKNNIISNSSFSWWAAWLNNNINKIVCAPSKWTRSGVQSNSFSPKSWYYIDVTD